MKWMNEALVVGKQGLNLKEVPVGCILLNEADVIIGKGLYFYSLYFIKVVLIFLNI
jgi:hypothetical protein